MKIKRRQLFQVNQQESIDIARLSNAETADFSERNISARLQSLYQYRGVCEASELDYALARLYPFTKMHGIDQAVQILLPVVLDNKRLVIVGDFDVDGATSTALAMRALTAFGAREVSYVVPNRFEYGYGLTPELVTEIIQQSPDIILTVDNGIASHAGIDIANQNGISVVVTDHHLPAETLPNAAAIVNPNQTACKFPSKAACGCTVVFYLLLALRAELIRRQYFEERGLSSPNMAQWLDLVALATVADVVPLDRNNRILVSQGIARIRSNRVCEGIRALLIVGKRRHERIVSSDFGFIVGPRLNAAGRLDDMSIGIECLLTDDPKKALELATTLDTLNQERKQIEQSMKAEAESMLPSALLDTRQQYAAGIALYHSDWHSGVIGILASRIKETCHRPVIAAADDGGEGGEAVIKASARSIPGFHIRDALDLVSKRTPDTIIKFGGHAMAAGLSINKSRWASFKEEFEKVCRELLSDDELEQVVVSDGELLPHEWQISQFEEICNAGPWGQGFPEPVFDQDFRVVNERVVGEKHLKLLLQPSLSNTTIDAIWFNADLDYWASKRSVDVHCVFQLSVNEYRQQQSPQIIIRHLNFV